MTEKSRRNDTITASGEALSMAQRWLGLSDAAEVLGQEAPELKEFEVSRPAGLGLGAKYLPHHKVAGVSSNVERSLGKRLHRLADGQAASTSAQPKRAKAESASRQRPGDGGATDQHNFDDDSDEEEKGRGAAFHKPKQVVQQQSWTEQLTSSKRKQKKSKWKDTGP